MKKTILLALVAMAIVAIPANAQTRREKKAAAKAQWEQQQQFAAEEAALRHQMKMDSIANAKKVAEAQRKEAERKAAEEKAAAAAQAAADKAAAEAKAKAEAEARAAQETEVNMPCEEYITTSELIRALGIGEDYDQQFAIDIARTEALNELASQVTTTVQSLLTKYNKSTTKQGKERSRESIMRTEQMIRTVVEQTTGYRIACRKITSYVLDGEKLYKAYIALETGTNDILESLYQNIQADEDLAIEASYEKFKEEFNQTFNK